VELLAQYPDVVWLVEHIFTERPHITSFIIDSEIVAEDRSTGELKSFQELSNRARKDVQLDDVRISVCVFAFDLMHFNGEVGCLPWYKIVSI
jgi:DNA ligase-1